MYCPACGTEAHDQTKYCTKCGVNLRRVKGVLGKGGAGIGDQIDRADRADWQKASLEIWKAEQEQKRKKSPEEKRINEIKTGVITSCAGLGIMIFLGFLFAGIASSAPENEKDILRAIPFAGLVPFLVGIGLIINGYFVSKRLVELKRQEQARDQQRMPQPSLFVAPVTSPVPQLSESTQPAIADYSVTESTTARLRPPSQVPAIQVPPSRDTN